MTDAVREQIAAALRGVREDKGIRPEAIEKSLGLGRGWVETFESGEDAVPVEILLAILAIIGVSREEFFHKVEESRSAGRDLFGEKVDDGVLIHFRYAAYDAKYTLPGGTTEQVAELLNAFRSRLSQVQNAESEEQLKAVKTNAVANSFLDATKIWPHVNPSDLWWFLIYRAFCDRFNHPSSYARADFGQSWKRTGGWALEEVVVRHYRDVLKASGIDISIVAGEERRKIAQGFNLRGRVEADKIDVVLAGRRGKETHPFGVVHVKASFAERRTDDVPLSQALIEAGYFSPLWTMDCKSGPAEFPVNKGELGIATVGPPDRRSAKRKDIEDEGYFSNCFSYNSNTRPTEAETVSGFKVILCDFSNSDDEFSRAAISHWNEFQKRI